MDLPYLEATVLTGVVTGIEVDQRELPLTAMFDKPSVHKNAPGLFTAWDERQPIRELSKTFEARTAIATPTDPGYFIPKTAGILHSFKKRTVKPEDYKNLRLIGSSDNVRDAGLKTLDNHFADIDRRFRQEPKEYLIAGAIQDNISVTVENVTITPDFGLDATHDVTASVSWATPSTDIEADVETIKRLLVQNSGRMPRYALMGRNVASYLRKNTTLGSWFKGTPSAPGQFDRLNGDTFDLLGLTWKTIRAGWLVSGTWTPVIPDDVVIFCPEPDESWFQIHDGLIAYPQAPMGTVRDFGWTYGVAVWGRLLDEPPAYTQFHRWAQMPILVFPWAIVRLDTTP